MVLELEFTLPRQALCHLNHVSALFVLVILEIGSHFFVQLAWNYDSPSCILPSKLGFQV
jgi:hypothetical protein